MDEQPIPLQPPASPFASLVSSRWFMPAVVVVVGFLLGISLGIGLMAAATPKPINPATYTHPLQVEQTSLQEQANYGRVMTINYTLLVAHYDQLVTDLNASNVTGAEVDATKLSTSTATYLSDLKALTVPACLKATNLSLIAGLTGIQQGAAALDAALSANDDGAATTAATQISQGFSQVTTAEHDYSAAAC